jgi:hypothetical protein
MVEVIIDGDRYVLKGRVAAMVRWLVERRHLVGLGHKTIHFMCRGKAIYPSIEEHHDSLTE